MLLTVISVGSILLSAILALVSMYTFDRIVKFEYEHFPEEWKRDGSPYSGIFWIPEGKEPRMDQSAGGRLAIRFILHTPFWIANSPMMQVLRYFRVIFGIFLTSLIMGIIVFFVNTFF